MVKTFALLWILSLLSFSPSALAGSFSLVKEAPAEQVEETLNDKDAIPLFRPDFDDGPKKISILSVGACVSTLQPILAPEKVIEAGLIALSSGAPDAQASCLNEIVKDWQQVFPEQSLYDDPKLLALEKEHSARAKALGCNCPYPAEDPKAEKWKASKAQYCEDAFTGPAEKAQVKAAKDAAYIAVSAYRLEKGLADDHSLFGEILFPKANDEERISLRKKLECLPSAFLPADCGGQALSPEESSSLSSKLSALNKKLQTEEVILERNRSELSDALNYRGPGGLKIDRAALYQLNAELTCTKKSWLYSSETVEAFCKSKGLPTGETSATLKQKIRDLIPNPDAVISDWKAGEPERKRHAKAARKKNIAESEAKYGIRRLLTLQHAFAKKKPGATIQDFCSDQERQLRKDRDYALKTKYVSLFSGPAQWNWAFEKGITEAEITALRKYTGNYYEEINPKIWKAKAGAGNLSEEEIVYIEKLNDAIDRAEPYREGPVIRYSELPADVLAAHAEGSVVTYDSFTSTSKRKDWEWKGGAEGASHRFVIFGGKSGAAIKEISTAPSEDEVLFKAGTRFKVLSRKERRPGSNVFDFVMAEVDEAGNVIAEVK